MACLELTLTLLQSSQEKAGLKVKKKEKVP